MLQIKKGVIGIIIPPPLPSTDILSGMYSFCHVVRLSFVHVSRHSSIFTSKFCIKPLFSLAVALVGGIREPLLTCSNFLIFGIKTPGRVAQSVGHLTRKSGVLGSIPGLATCFRFSFRFFKKGSCQLLAKVCARSTG